MSTMAGSTTTTIECDCSSMAVPIRPAARGADDVLTSTSHELELQQARIATGYGRRDRQSPLVVAGVGFIGGVLAHQYVPGHDQGEALADIPQP